MIIPNPNPVTAVTAANASIVLFSFVVIVVCVCVCVVCVVDTRETQCFKVYDPACFSVSVYKLIKKKNT